MATRKAVTKTEDSENKLDEGPEMKGDEYWEPQPVVPAPPGEDYPKTVESDPDSGKKDAQAEAAASSGPILADDHPDKAEEESEKAAEPTPAETRASSSKDS